MRWLVLALILLTGWARGQDVLQEFSGSGATTTGFFTVSAKWEVRWNARQVVSVAVMSSDGTIVAGAAGVLRGSLFVPAGGQYYLKITDGTVAPVAANTTPALTNATPVPTATNTAPAANASATNAPPANSPPAASPDAETVAWHVQVIALGDTPVPALTVFAPYFAMPDTAVAPPPPVPSAPTLTPEQLHAMVTIKGARAQGVGFLVKVGDSVCVVTALELLAANPDARFFDSAGAELTPLEIRAANDRDMAMVPVKEDRATLLAVVADRSAPPAIGDAVLVPGVSAQGDVLAPATAKLAAAAPTRVDFDAFINVLSAGAPVIRPAGGEVVAVAVPTKRVDLSAEVAAVWTANSAPGAARLFPTYGARMQGVAGWDAMPLTRFVDETSFLRAFHEDTRCLDSFLNYHRRRTRNGDQDAVDRYYEKNAKIKQAAELYKKFSTPDADHNQALDAARELLSDLITVSNGGVDQVRGLNSPAAYVRQSAAEELAYRAAIRKQLDFYGDNISRFDNIARYR